MIYLDNSATTKPHEEVLHSYEQVSNQFFANPSSIHQLGAQVEQLQLKAREQAAYLLKIDPKEVIFTSGGTEGNNLAIKGIALNHQQRGKHIITTEIEHASVFETCKSLEKLGYDVTYLPVNKSGVIDINELEKAITNETILISVMHVNNEMGSIQPIRDIAQLAKRYPKLHFHVDAVQSIGKIPLQLIDSGIDLCTISGHKINGLNGTGMLFIKEGTSLFPLFHGGGQEFQQRSGTENVAGNVSFVKALRLIKEKETSKSDHFKELALSLRKSFQAMEGVFINSPENHAPHILNVSVPNLKPETVIHALYDGGVIISTQSACASKASEKSRVLHACGFSHDRSISGLRISMSYETTKGEIEQFSTIFHRTIKELFQVLE